MRSNKKIRAEQEFRTDMRARSEIFFIEPHVMVKILTLLKLLSGKTLQYVVSEVKAGFIRYAFSFLNSPFTIHYVSAFCRNCGVVQKLIICTKDAILRRIKSPMPSSAPKLLAHVAEMTERTRFMLLFSPRLKITIIQIRRCFIKFFERVGRKLSIR